MIYIAEWKPTTVSDEWKSQTLDQWQRGCLSPGSVKQDIKLYKEWRKRDQKRLDQMRQYVSEHYVGFDEWIDAMIIRVEHDLKYWDDSINHLQWLINQPTYLTESRQ
jgi:hypothetical protein